MKFLRILPHLPVDDLPAEVTFYRLLGLEIFHRRHNFTSVEDGDGTLVHFGIRKAAGGPPEGFEWKLEVDDIGQAMEIALTKKLEILAEPVLQWYGKWTMKLRTPNNYTLTLEGMNPSTASKTNPSSASR